MTVLLRHQNGLFVPTAEKVQDLALRVQRRGIEGSTTRGFSTWAEQQRLHDKGRVVLGEPCWHKGERVARPAGTCADHPLGSKVTNAKPGESFHNIARAVDFCVDLNPDPSKVKPAWPNQHPLWDALAIDAPLVGLVWGGTFSDKPHVEDRSCAPCGRDHDQSIAKSLGVKLLAHTFHPDGRCKVTR